MVYSRAIDEAIAAAAIAHRNQLRKDPTLALPYIAHPVMVALLLQRCGFDDDTIVAAILHDVVEDTDLSLEDVRRQFGPAVATLVDYVSEQDKSLRWEARKAAYVRRLAGAPVNALAISAADKIHNLRAVVRSIEQARARGMAEDHVWRIFKRGPRVMLDHYEEVRQTIAARSDLTAPFTPLLNELDAAMAAFGTIASGRL